MLIYFYMQEGNPSRRDIIKRFLNITGSIYLVVNFIEDSFGEEVSEMTFNMFEERTDNLGNVWYIPKFRDPNNQNAEARGLYINYGESLKEKIELIFCADRSILSDLPNGRWEVFDKESFLGPKGEKMFRGVIGWKTSPRT
jgi:hypothetical protein